MSYRAVAPRRLTLRCPGPRPIPGCCLLASPRCEVLRTARSCAPAPPPLLPRAAASRDASLLLACLPPRPCPEARLCAPRCCSPSTGQVTEIEWAWIPVRPSVPPPHPVPASMSVGRRRARGFPPGQSPSPLVGAVPRPTLGFRLLPWIFGTLLARGQRGGGPRTYPCQVHCLGRPLVVSLRWTPVGGRPCSSVRRRRCPGLRAFLSSPPPARASVSSAT